MLHVTDIRRSLGFYPDGHTLTFGQDSDEPPAPEGETA
jgi:hypothetical protein